MRWVSEEELQFWRRYGAEIERRLQLSEDA